MNDDAKNSAEAQRETLNRPEMGVASTTVAPDRDTGRLVIAFVWVMRYGVHLTVTNSLLLVGLVPVFDMRVPRSLQVIGLTTDLLVAIAGRWVGGQVVDLMSGPQMVWFVDVDLLDRSDVGVYACPAPRQSERTAVDDQPWWVTPSLAFGRDVGLDTREVAGTWVGSLPDPVLARTPEYFRYNRKQLKPKARKGESLEINSFTIVRTMVVKTVKHVVWTFEKGALPDDGDALHAEIDSAPEDFDLDGSDSIFDENLTEWIPGNDDPTSNPLADLDQRRKQHAANGESE